MTYRHLSAAFASTLVLPACFASSDDTLSVGATLTQTTTLDTAETGGDGDGDGDTGDGDGDGDPGDGDGDGDGDTGDGDGDGDTGGGPACTGAEAPGGVLQLGQQVSHWGGGFTVTGDSWDYCELEGTPFLLIISAGWCGPCQDLAAGLAGQASSWGTDLDPIRAGLQNGTLSATEILLDNFQDFDAVALADLQAWEGMFHNEFVHLLGDPTPGLNGDEPLWIYLSPVHMGSVPAAVLVDANFNLEVMGLGESVATAAANYGG